MVRVHLVALGCIIQAIVRVLLRVVLVIIVVLLQGVVQILSAELFNRAQRLIMFILVRNLIRAVVKVAMFAGRMVDTSKEKFFICLVVLHRPRRTAHIAPSTRQRRDVDSPTLRGRVLVVRATWALSAPTYRCMSMVSRRVPRARISIPAVRTAIARVLTTPTNYPLIVAPTTP